MMRALIFPVLAGLLLCAGCKRKANPSEAEGASSGEVGIVELQRQLEEALKR